MSIYDIHQRQKKDREKIMKVYVLCEEKSCQIQRNGSKNIHIVQDIQRCPMLSYATNAHLKK